MANTPLIEAYKEALRSTAYMREQNIDVVRNYIKREMIRHMYRAMDINAEYGDMAVRHPIYWAERRSDGRRQGRIIGRAKGYLEKHSANTFTDSKSIKFISKYLHSITHLTPDAVAKVEPSVAEVSERSANWETLDMVALLVGREPDGYTVLRRLTEAETNALDNMKMFNVFHRVHVSVTDPFLIAYYPTMRHYREGREVKTKLGKYLTTYRDAIGLTDAEIKLMSERYRTFISARANWEVKFAESNDPDKWVEIYNSDDVRSCMRGMDAVRVYAHDKSELRLAYLETSGKVIGRCIVRDDPNGDMTGWLRVYPDPNGNSEGRYLLDYLQANGYPKMTNLDGVLLRHELEGGSIVCPYIDCGNGGEQRVDVEYIDGKPYLRVGEGEYDATNTDGYVNRGAWCEECECYHDEDDVHYIESVERSICEGCLDNNYTYAIGYRGQSDYYPNDEVVRCESDNEWYYEGNLSDNGVFMCEISGEHYHEDDLVSTDRGLVHTDLVTALDYPYDEYDYCATDDAKQLSDGTWCHENDYDKLQAELDEQEVEDAEQE